VEEEKLKKRDVGSLQAKKGWKAAVRRRASRRHLLYRAVRVTFCAASTGMLAWTFLLSLAAPRAMASGGAIV